MLVKDTYIYINEQQSGPYSVEEIYAMLNEDQVAWSDLCWKEGLAEWCPLKEIFSPLTPPEAASNVLKIHRTGESRNYLLNASGVNGQIELQDHKITIKRKGALGLMTQGLKGDKDILISQISSIQFKEAGPFFNGYLQFAFVGGHDSKGGLWDATRDENTVMFNLDQQSSFSAIKSAVEK